MRTGNRGGIAGTVLMAVVIGAGPAAAQSLEATPGPGTSVVIPPHRTPPPPALDLSPSRTPEQTEALLHSYDKLYGYRGWDFPFPTYGDTILQNAGGFRSTLAQYGFGFTDYNDVLFSDNLLDHPTTGPGQSLAPKPGFSQQQYFGQQASVVDFDAAYLTYDLGRIGIPDGQLSITGQYTYSSDPVYTRTRFGITGLAWDQLLLNKAVEFKVGYIANGNEFAGTIVGGNLANPFGPSASIIYELGMSLPGATQPTAKVIWHIDSGFYEQLGLMRSLGIDGPTNNVFYDDSFYNPTGFRFGVPNGNLLVVNEVGYRTNSGVDTPETWVRLGGMFNNSHFADFGSGGTVDSAGAFYVLADRQLLQFAPDSHATAYRGLYAGATAMVASPRVAAFSQNYEARLYTFGIFDRRPADEIALVYDYNVFSHDLASAVNRGGRIDGIYAHARSNTLTLDYTARVVAGVYFTLGFGYTDHPSLAYTRTEGSNANILSSLFTSF